MSRYREIWVVDMDPNLSTAEALGPARTIKEHYQEMIDLYTRRIQVYSDDPDSHVSLASVYLTMGNKEKALESLDSFTKSATNLSAVAATLGGLGLELIREDPGFALELFGRAHGGKGQRDDAVRWYQKATAQMPADKESFDATLKAMLKGVHSMASSQLGIDSEEK